MARGDQRWWRGFGALVVGVIATVGLVPNAAQAATAPKAKTYAVRHVTFTFVDHGRSTNDPTGARSANSRTLVTEAYIPKGTGTFPLVVMAHGNAGNPGKLTQLLTAWAQAGYVVVAPAFPLTNDLTTAPSIIVDFRQQPADVSFVISRVLSQAKHRGSPLYHHVDADHIGLAGHSLGGGTAYGVAFNACCRDKRIDAVVTMDAVKLPFGDDPYAFKGKPLLLIHIAGDPVVPYKTSQDIYAIAAPPKYLMTLNQGIHFEPFENAPSPHDGAVIAASTAFWDGYLRDNAAARRRVITTGTEAGLSQVTATLR
jgi:dienelactone hydrolase